MTLMRSANGASNISEFFRVFKLAVTLAGSTFAVGPALLKAADAPPAKAAEATPARPIEGASPQAVVSPQPAAAIRLPIADQVPLNPRERYEVEIARDPGFGQIVLKAEILGATLAWDAPSEGVYHWRLAKLNKKNVGGDVVTFVSGSVVAIDAKTKREKPARITWEPALGADRYKLNFVDITAKAWSITTTKTEFVVPETMTSGAVEIIPFTGGRRTFRDFHYNPTLKLDSGFPPPPPPPAPIAARPVEALADDQKDEPKVDAAPLAPESTSGSRHLVQLYGMYVREDLTFSKLEIRLKSEENLAGFGGRIWTQPTEAFVVSAEAAGYRHTATLTQPDILNDQEVALDVWRYAGHALLGVNLLSPLGVKDHVLVVSGGGALTRLPFLPEAYTVESGVAPELGEDDRPLLGGGLTYGWFGEHLALTLEGSRYMDQDGAGTLSEGRGFIQFRISHGISIDLGGFGRLTEVDTCAGDAGACLSEGTVTTQSLERAGTLGLSARI